MELKELYSQIKNPIDDVETIKKLISIYSEKSTGLGGFYGHLTKTIKKEYTGKYYQNDADVFYSMMFNKWKNSILAMSKDEFIELYKRGSYGQDFIKMRNYLRNIKDVRTMKEANEVLFGNKNDKELEDALEKYRWSAFGAGSGWIHVCSRYATAKKDKYPNIEHRLYVNTESIDTYKMITSFVKKCDKHKLPYYFKFDQFADRDDTIVIYSSTENLTKYIEILQEIKREEPELTSRVKNPPLLSGKIDNWIGYGSEPRDTPDGQKHSFNDLRANLIEKAIEKTIKDWILTHRNMEIKYHGQTISFQEYFAVKCTEMLCTSLENKYTYSEKNDKKEALSQSKKYDPMATAAKIGITLEDTKSPQFKQYSYNKISKDMNLELPKFCSSEESVSISIELRNKKQINITENDFQKVIEEISVIICKKDPSFITLVQNQIKRDAIKIGIDPNKFCFDINAINAMNKISKSLINRKVKLPNGMEINAKQFIEETILRKARTRYTLKQYQLFVSIIKNNIETIINNPLQVDNIFLDFDKSLEVQPESGRK